LQVVLVRGCSPALTCPSSINLTLCVMQGVATASLVQRSHPRRHLHLHQGLQTVLSDNRRQAMVSFTGVSETRQDSRSSVSVRLTRTHGRMMSMPAHIPWVSHTHSVGVRCRWGFLQYPVIVTLCTTHRMRLPFPSPSVTRFHGETKKPRHC
jgi:hypothetical protein